MGVPGNLEKYVCLECRHKIPTSDLEEIFVSNLEKFSVNFGDNSINLADHWFEFSQKEKRLIIEQICEKIIIGKTEIEIEYAYAPSPYKAATFEQQNERGNETLKTGATEPVPNEPLMNEVDAARFLGISRMTLLRKRNACEIGFYRVGFRVLYSKEKHLLPFLENCEK